MFCLRLSLPLQPLYGKGEVLEWLKRHAWKACNRQNRFAGSNPVLSAGDNRFKAPRKNSGLCCSLRRQEKRIQSFEAKANPVLSAGDNTKDTRWGIFYMEGLPLIPKYWVIRYYLLSRDMQDVVILIAYNNALTS